MSKVYTTVENLHKNTFGLLRGITVCVGYDDLLKITLPYNRHHFINFMVVTTPDDTATLAIAEELDCQTFVTDSFYKDGATFNKWRALEEGLDAFGRFGFMTIMDCDVLWPKSCPTVANRDGLLSQGSLITPYRRMLFDLPTPFKESDIPPESEWEKYQRHSNTGEWAGYTQIFHANDEVLKKHGTPWHEINWSHAGGADSFFQQLWHKNNKVRPNWEVLHLGKSGYNWRGRITDRIDGKNELSEREKRQGTNELTGMLRQRRRNKQQRKTDVYEHERINLTEDKK